MNTTILAVALAAGVAAAGARAEPVGQIESLSHAIHAVGDLDTTLAFYRDVFGIDGRPVDFANPAKLDREGPYPVCRLRARSGQQTYPAY